MRLCVLEALHDLKDASKKAEFGKVLAEMKEIDDRYKGSYQVQFTQHILNENGDGVNDPEKGWLGKIKDLSDARNKLAQQIFDKEWARQQERQKMVDAEAFKALEKFDEEEARMFDLQRRYEAGDATVTAAQQKELEAYACCHVSVRPDPLAAGKVTFCQKTRDASELYFHAAVVRQKVRDATPCPLALACPPLMTARR